MSAEEYCGKETCDECKTIMQWTTGDGGEDIIGGEWCSSRQHWYCNDCFQSCDDQDCEDCSPPTGCEYCKIEGIECTFWDYIDPNNGCEYSKALCAECRLAAELEVSRAKAVG
jgi:hypothetical protein